MVVWVQQQSCSRPLTTDYRLSTADSLLAFSGFVLPDGFALFEEGSESFFKVGSATDAGALQDRALKIVVDTSGGCRNEEMLGTGDAAGAGSKNGLSEFVCPRHQILRRNDFVDEAQFLGLSGFDQAAGEEEVAGAFLADLARQKYRNDGW